MRRWFPENRISISVPERTRELARFMATQPIPSTSGNSTNDGQGVQMLGANIVIETTWNTAHQPLPDSENPPWFIPRFPEASDLIGATDGCRMRKSRLTGLSDGAKVYPWFRGVSLELSGGNAASKLLPIINSTTFYLCGVNPDTPGRTKCNSEASARRSVHGAERKAGEKSGQLTLISRGRLAAFLYVARWHELRALRRYRGCKVKPRTAPATFCVRFSVYTPFFQSSGDMGGQKCTDLQNPACYRDPDPYVLIETKDENGIPEDVAIFGVVDPQIGANVGLLNFAWANTASRNFKTETVVQDPAQAMKQMLDSFSRKFDENGYTKEIGCRQTAFDQSSAGANEF